MASPPVVYNDILYGGFDKYIYAIYVVNGSIKWTYATEGLIESTPAISQGTVYAGSNDKKIYALDASNKNLRWSFTTGGSIYSSPAVVNGVLYVGSRDNNIYSIDSVDGTLKWREKTNDWVRSSPAVLENKVFVGSNDNSIYALNADNGDVLWKYLTNGRVESQPVIVKGTLYAGSEDGTIYAIGMESGGLVDKYEVGNGIISLALSDNMLFATSRDGYVYAFGARPEIKTTVPAIQIEKIPPVLKINPVPVNATSEKLMISGTAVDTSGILVVTVNGMEAGTNNWNATLTLLPGPNIITIVAVDRYGNIKTESRTVSYIPPPINQETPSIPGFSLSFIFISFITIAFLKKIKN